MNTPADLAHRIRLEASLIPYGATIRIQGSEPISSFNLAQHVAKMLDSYTRGESVYLFFCDRMREVPTPTGIPSEKTIT